MSDTAFIPSNHMKKVNSMEVSAVFFAFMRSEPSIISGIVASLALVTLTLGVFSMNQSSGPEGALHSFFRSARKLDLQGVVSATGGVDGLPVRALANEVSAMLRIRGAYYEVAEIMRDGNECMARVYFYTPRGIESTFWFLYRSGNRWYVDAPRTAMLYAVPVQIEGRR